MDMLHLNLRVGSSFIIVRFVGMIIENYDIWRYNTIIPKMIRCEDFKCPDCGSTLEKKIEIDEDGLEVCYCICEECDYIMWCDIKIWNYQWLDYDMI